jgi:hypothetical protein
MGETLIAISTSRKRLVRIGLSQSKRFGRKENLLNRVAGRRIGVSCMNFRLSRALWIR